MAKDRARAAVGRTVLRSTKDGRSVASAAYCTYSTVVASKSTAHENRTFSVYWKTENSSYVCCNWSIEQGGGMSWLRQLPNRQRRVADHAACCSWTEADEKSAAVSRGWWTFPT